MRRFMKRLHRGEKGFTLIELLIVVAILGILAAVVVPNVGGFFSTGKLNAANTEVQNVKTAAMAYYAETGTWPDDSSFLYDPDPNLSYLNEDSHSLYAFDTDWGTITGATLGYDDESLDFDATGQEWVKEP
jgi:prepilin-type N-terminal cleavage/methylation domain-containing protein